MHPSSLPTDIQEPQYKDTFRSGITIDSDPNQIANTVIDDWKTGRSARSVADAKIEDNYGFYRNSIRPKNKPWRGCSNINVPLMQSIIDGAFNNLKQAMLGDSPLFNVVSSGNTPPRTGKVHTAIIRSQFDQFPCYRKTFERMIFQALMQGCWIVYTSWYEKTVSKPTRILVQDPNTGMMVPIIVPKKTVISYPKIDNIDITDIVVSPEADCINSTSGTNPAKWVTIRKQISMIELSNPYLYDQSQVSTIKYPSTNTSPKSDTEQNHLDYLGMQPSHSQLPFHALPYYERWEWIPVRSQSGYEPKLYLFGVVDCEGRPVLVRKQECPYEHYSIPVVWQSLYADHPLYSISMAQKTVEIQKEVNHIHNSRRDSSELAMMKIFKVRAGSRFNKNQSFEPGAFLDVGDENDITQLIVNDQTAITAYQDEQLATQYAEKSTGINPILMASQPISNSNQTATEIVAMRNASNTVIKSIINYWNATGLKELGQQWVSLNQQFYPIDRQIEQKYVPEELTQDLQQGMLQILIDDMAGDTIFKIDLQSDEVLDSMIRQQSVNALQVLAQLPLVQNSQQIQYTLVRHFLNTYDDPELRLPPFEQLMQEQQQMAQSQIQMQYQQTQMEHELKLRERMASEELKSETKISNEVLKQSSALEKEKIKSANKLAVSKKSGAK